jgi:hypothetical protein
LAVVFASIFAESLARNSGEKYGSGLREAKHQQQVIVMH